MADIDEYRIGKDLALVRQSEPALTQLACARYCAECFKCSFKLHVSLFEVDVLLTSAFSHEKTEAQRI